MGSSRLKNPVDPVVDLGARIEGKKEHGIILEFDRGGKDFAKESRSRFEVGEDGFRIVGAIDADEDAGRAKIDGDLDVGHGDDGRGEGPELLEEDGAERFLEEASDALRPKSFCGHRPKRI
jgi:hypothetical protein